MQWEKTDEADRTFGTTQADPSKLKRHASSKVQDLFPKFVGGLDSTDRAETISEDLPVENNSGSEMEYQKVSGRAEIGTWMNGLPKQKRFKNRQKSRRNRRRLQFNSEVEEFGEESRELQSEVEAMPPTDFDPVFISRGRTLSTECVPDVELESLAKKRWPHLRLSTKPRLNGREFTLFSSSGEQQGIESQLDGIDVESSEADDTDDAGDLGTRGVRSHEVAVEEPLAPVRRLPWTKRRTRSSMVRGN